MDSLSEKFREWFGRFGLELAPEDVRTRSPGTVRGRGWTVQYCFGADERGDYVDFYAVHRMTTDEHTRLYGDGHHVELDALTTICELSPDPDTQRILRENFEDYNRRVRLELEKKGF